MQEKVLLTKSKTQFSLVSTIVPDRHVYHSLEVRWGKGNATGPPSLAQSLLLFEGLGVPFKVPFTPWKGWS
jgi:hypothetical protein